MCSVCHLFLKKLNTFFFKQFRNTFLIVCYTCVFMFDFTNCLLVLVNSDAHMGPGVVINLVNLVKSC